MRLSVPLEPSRTIRHLSCVGGGARPADSERKLPCRACIACHYLSCRKAGAFRLRGELLAKMYGLGARMIELLKIHALVCTARVLVFVGAAAEGLSLLCRRRAGRILY
jgi:hypothetical protein